MKEFNCQEQCGECCKHVRIELKLTDVNDPVFRADLKMHGITVISPFKGHFGAYAIIDALCRHFVPGENGKGTCAIYDSRPDYCKAYNCANDPIMQMLNGPQSPAVEKGNAK